jgi:hypothetical protein
MTVVEHNFDAIDGVLDHLNTLNQKWMEIKEELESELHGWAAYRTGDAHEAATTWTMGVATTLDNTTTASISYAGKGKTANAEMRQQELTNTAGW